MLVTDLFADTFFVADIFLNFNTGFIREQVAAQTPFEPICTHRYQIYCFIWNSILPFSSCFCLIPNDSQDSEQTQADFLWSCSGKSSEMVRDGPADSPSVFAGLSHGPHSRGQKLPSGLVCTGFRCQLPHRSPLSWSETGHLAAPPAPEDHSCSPLQNPHPSR